VKAKSRVVRGFSLVEVALALAILAFTLLTLLALLSEGVGSYRDAGAQSTMVNIATMVVRDLQVTPTSTTATESTPEYDFQIPPVGGAGSSGTPSPNTVYVDANGTATATTVGAAPTSSSIYRITVYFIPPSTGRTATVARILITFPAHADPTPASSPTQYTDIFQTVVNLNRN